jgi:S1-C subfamily serine protease
MSGRTIIQTSIPIQSVFSGQQRCSQILANAYDTYCFNIEQMVSTNIQLYPGGSGSPVFNLKNELVGLMSSTAPMSNFGHMVLLSDIKRVLNLY